VLQHAPAARHVARSCGGCAHGEQAYAVLPVDKPHHGANVSAATRSDQPDTSRSLAAAAGTVNTPAPCCPSTSRTEASRRDRQRCNTHRPARHVALSCGGCGHGEHVGAVLPVDKPNGGPAAGFFFTGGSLCCKGKGEGTGARSTGTATRVGQHPHALW
jgi:hypothetical protein